MDELARPRPQRFCPWCVAALEAPRCPKCGSPARGAEDVQPGESLPYSGRLLDDRYRITRFIGGGGMGTVYRAFDRFLERMVAVKFLLTPDGTRPSGDVTSRFSREARALARVDSPHVVGFLDYGRYDGVPFLVMELLRGPTLKQIIKAHRSMDLPLVAAVGLSLSRALQAAHATELVHRDLKPDNIMLHRGDDGDVVVKVVDFGVVRAFGDSWSNSLATRTGVAIGTPAYMAPEQLVGQKATPATDLYALGTILFEVVAGRRPFEDRDQRACFERLRNPAPALEQFRPDLPVPFVRLVQDLLVTDPAQRTVTAGHAIEIMSCWADLHRLDELVPRETDDALARTAPKAPSAGVDEYGQTSAPTRPARPRGPAVPPAHRQPEHAPDESRRRPVSLAPPEPVPRVAPVPSPPPAREEGGAAPAAPPVGRAGRSRRQWMVTAALVVAFAAVLTWALGAFDASPGGEEPDAVSAVLRDCDPQFAVVVYGVVTSSHGIPLTGVGAYQLTDRTGSIWLLSDVGSPPEGAEIIAAGIPVPTSEIYDVCKGEGGDREFCRLLSGGARLIAGSCVLFEGHRE